MAILAKDTGNGDFERPETGPHHAICAFVTDLGVQETTYGSKRQVAVSWELMEKMTDGRPFMLTKIYTLSLNKKATLRKDLEGWRGKPFTEQDLENGFDLEQLIAKHCTVNVNEDNTGEKIYSNVVAVSRPMAGMPALTVHNKELPEWIRKKRDVGHWDDNGTQPDKPFVEPEQEDLPF